MGPGEEWGLSDDEAVENIIHGNILFAIAQHTFDFAHLSELNSLSDILVLADDIEEFSRFGRQQRSRKYYDTVADVKIEFKPKFPTKEKKVAIIITYNVYNYLTPKEYHEYFYRKAEQLCRIYTLHEKKRDKDNYCRIRSIRINTEYNRTEPENLYFLLSDNLNKIEGRLPKSNAVNVETLNKNSDGYDKTPKTFRKRTYPMKCLDDKLYVWITKENGNYKDDVLLKDWLNIKTENM
jgi:hypothetical protein